MAGDWIKMRGNLWDDPRVGKLCDLTGQSEAAIIGALYWLWATADQHTEDGCMPGLSLRQIDRKTGVDGMGAALVAINWLRDDPQGVVIVGFDEHNGASAKKRCQTAKRVAAFKAGNAQETQDDDAGNASSVTESLAERDLEKRREEEIHSVAKATDGAAGPAVSQSPENPHVQTKAELWLAAVAVLKAGGCDSDALARSFMGKLVKDYGHESVSAAVASAATAQPADAREYLKATCQRLKGERKDPVTVADDPRIAQTAAAAEAERRRWEALKNDPEEQAKIRAAIETARQRLKAA